MQVRVKIRRDVKNYFDKYGSLSYCVNRLFDELGEQALGLDIVATTVYDADICTTTVTVTSPVYIAYVREFDSRHRFVSIAKLLTYAAEMNLCKNWPATNSSDKLLNQIALLTPEHRKELLNKLKERYKL